MICKLNYFVNNLIFKQTKLLQAKLLQAKLLQTKLLQTKFLQTKFLVVNYSILQVLVKQNSLARVLFGKLILWRELIYFVVLFSTE